VTDRRTDGRAIAYSALSMLSRANQPNTCKDIVWMMFRMQTWTTNMTEILYLHRVDAQKLPILRPTCCSQSHLLTQHVASEVTNGHAQHSLSVIHSFIHFWPATLQVHSAKCRHQSPEWAIPSHVACFVQGEVKWFQVQLDSLHQCVSVCHDTKVPRPTTEERLEHSA